MRVGAHVTIKGGFENSIKKAIELKVDCMQIFPSSPQIWNIPTRDEQELKDFRQNLKKFHINPVFFHSIYLINLASDNNKLYWGSIDSLRKTLQLAKRMDCKGVIFHTGSSGDKNFEQVLPKIHKAIIEILKNSPEDLFLVIENSAGAGNTVGKTPKQIGKIVKGIKDDRIKICLDSQHIFASGYDLRKKSEVERLFSEIDKEIGIKRLIAIHISDSKSECGSNIDRHENIGDGKIGINGLSNLLSHKAVSNLPLFLETPGDKSDIGKENVNKLRRIVENIHRG